MLYKSSAKKLRDKDYICKKLYSRILIYAKLIQNVLSILTPESPVTASVHWGEPVLAEKYFRARPVFSVPLTSCQEHFIGAKIILYRHKVLPDFSKMYRHFAFQTWN